MHELHDEKGFRLWLCAICYVVHDQPATIIDHLKTIAHKMAYVVSSPFRSHGRALLQTQDQKLERPVGRTVGEMTKALNVVVDQLVKGKPKEVPEVLRLVGGTTLRSVA